MQSAEVNTDDPVASDDELGTIERTRRNAKFISELVMVHPKLFLIAMAGAAVFALLTVASSAAIGRVIDNVILPHETRAEVVRSLRILRNKRESRPPKKHGNIPL